MNSPASTLRARASVGYLGAVALGVVCAALISYEYSLSHYLHTDDGWQVGMALLGQPPAYPQQPFLHWLIRTLAGSMLLVKVLPIIGHGLLAGAVYLLLRRSSESSWLPGLVALVVVFYPVSVDQTFYVIGSHPTWGVAFALYSLYFFDRGWREEKLLGVGLVALSAALGLAAALTSPMLTLATYAPFVWLGVCFLADRSSPRRPGPLRTVAYVTLLSVPVIVQLSRGLLRNDYSAAGLDRIDITAANVLPRLGDALSLLLTPLQNWYAGVLLALLVGTFLLAAGTRRDTGATARLDLRVAWMALLLSALVFAPNVAVGEGYFRSRYVVAPFVAAMVAVASVLLQTIRIPRGRLWLVPTLLLVLAVAFEMRWTNAMIHAQRGAELAMFNAMLETAEAEKHRWPDDASVLLIVEAGRKAPAPWWTTPVVNYLTGRRDLFVMVGAADDVQRGISAPSESTSMKGKGAGSAARWWSARNDKVYRQLRARVRQERGGGLAGDHPLFVYTRADSDAPFVSTPLTVVSGVDEAHVVRTGERPGQARDAALDLLSAGCEPLPGHAVFVGAAPVADGLELLEGPTSWSLDGTEVAQTTAVPGPDEVFLLSFRLRPREPVGSRSYGDSTPPMPFAASVGDESLLAYHRGAEFYFSYVGRLSKRGWFSNVAADGVDVSIYGRQGCRMVLSLDGRMVDLLPGDQLFEDWTLGKGIKQRYWAGEIEGWRLYRAPEGTLARRAR